MTLNNVFGMSLERIEQDLLNIQRLLEAGKRDLIDAQIEVVSNE
jgi:hypothetical protein